MMELIVGLLLAASPANCDVSKDERETLLAQDWETFDQSATGFRSLVNDDRYCASEAGELIEAYLASHPELSEKERYVSEWHAGQQFASVDNRPRALAHFYRGFNPHEDPAGSTRWNAYARATIAFLENDRDTLEASLKVLEAHQDNRMNAINVKLVRSFVHNFGKTYDEAVRFAFNPEKVSD